MLADAGAANAEDYRAAGKGVMPLTLVVIDNYAGFMENYERFAEPLLKLLREGMACGIQFIVTMNAPMDMRSRWSQSFTTTIPLQLNERADYYSYLGLTPQMMPTGEPGSGLTIFNGSVVQFQCAYVADPKACSTLALRAASGYRAPALRYIDKQQLYAEFLQETAIQALPEDASARLVHAQHPSVQPAPARYVLLLYQRRAGRGRAGGGGKPAAEHFAEAAGMPYCLPRQHRTV